MGMFKDFIPKGENLGGQGSGFKDFVPDPKPVAVTVDPIVLPDLDEVVVEKPKKKGK